MPARDELYHLVGDLIGAHLRLQIVGRDLGRVDQHPVFARVQGLHAAVKEEGDMGVFLGLRDAQLLKAEIADVFAKGIGKLLGLKGDMHIGHRRVVLGHAHIVEREEAAGPLKAFEIRIHQGAGDLPCAVRPEVKEDHRVVFPDARALGAHHGLNELVGLLRLHRMPGCPPAGRAPFCPRRAPWRPVGLLHPIPAVVPIHGVVAAHDGCHLAHAQLRRICACSCSTIAVSRGWGHVAPVHEAVDINLLQPVSAWQAPAAPTDGSLWLCTPPSDIRPIRCSALPLPLAVVHGIREARRSQRNPRLQWIW